MQPKILYLYAELMGYQIPILNEYVHKYKSIVHVVHWDEKKLTPYSAPNIYNVKYYTRSKYDSRKLCELVKEIRPDIAYICGWQDKGYLPPARILRNMKIPVVAGFDDKWHGSIKQKIASLIGPLVLKKYISHAWVSGPLQFEYAKKLGFKNDKIIYNLLSANTHIFNKSIIKTSSSNVTPRKFIYVGNFRSVKGTDILIEAYKIYKKKFHGKWKFICVGNGEMERLLHNIVDVEIHGFSDQATIAKYAKEAGVFVLPSRNDQWGVVVHEFASLGLPLILSENVGARSTFLIEGYNGLVFKNNSSMELAKALDKMSKKTEEELVEMGNRSAKLASRIDAEISAASFLSILENVR